VINLTFVRIAEADVPRVRAWLAGLEDRAAELAESYRCEHTRQELFYLIDGREDPILVIAAESGDPKAGAQTFLGSKLPIDAEFKAMIQEVGTVLSGAELLFDSNELLPVTGERDG
jgi:hypothetical protein